MNKTISSIFKMKTYMGVNIVLYYLSLLPVIGGVIKKTAYEKKGTKNIIAICVFAIQAGIIVVVKSVSAFIFIVVPTTVILAEKGIVLENYREYYLQAFLFLFCILGAFQQSRVFTVTKTKYACFEYFKIPVKQCIVAHLIIEYITQFIAIIFVLAICQYFFELKIMQLIILYISYVSIQLMGEAVYLYYFLKRRVVLSKKIQYDIFLVMICVCGAYYPLLLENPFFVSDILLQPISTCIIFFAGVYSIYYIFWSYEGYDSNISRQMSTTDLVANIAREAYQKELTINFQTEVDEIEHKQATEKKRGYSLLNFLFQLRLKKAITRSLLMRILILMMGAVSGIIVFLYDAASLTKFIGRIDRIAAIFPLIIYQISFGDKFCKILFHNCDSKLLEYGFYRKKSAILKNYIIRAKMIIWKNIQLGVSLCLLLSVIMILCGYSILTKERIMIFFTVINLFITFGIQHLSVYYAIQPYIIGSNISNPLRVASQMVILMITFFLMNLDLSSIYIMIILNIISLLFDMVLVLAVIIRAPAKFKLH